MANDDDLASAFPNSPEMFRKTATDDDAAAREAFPNSPEMFSGVPRPTNGKDEPCRTDVHTAQ